MNKFVTLSGLFLFLGIVAVPTMAAAQAKTCQMEQQCHCTYVKVCR